MPFATAATEKRRADLAAAFPQVGRCLKCFKHLIVDPESKCTVEAGKKNCTRCSGGGATCEKIPRALSEACRVFEDNVEKFNDFLKNQENNVDPAFQPFSFDDWKEKWKFTDSSRRVTSVAGGPDPWEGVPTEFKTVYDMGVKLMANISAELKSMSVSGASNTENAMLMAVKELTAEIKAFRECYMAAHKLVPDLEERIPEEIARHFTNV